MVSEKQKELDDIKLADSQRLGKDMCGSYAFCKHCKKEEENPCEQAYKRLMAKKKPKNKAKINGKEFRATVVDKD